MSKNKSDIQNCRFTFRCKKTWDALIETKQDDIRYCPDCDRGVYRCKTDDDLADAIKKNRCVVIVQQDGNGSDLPQEDWLVGDPSPNYSVGSGDDLE